MSVLIWFAEFRCRSGVKTAATSRERSSSPFVAIACYGLFTMWAAKGGIGLMPAGVVGVTAGSSRVSIELWAASCISFVLVIGTLLITAFIAAACAVVPENWIRIQLLTPAMRRASATGTVAAEVITTVSEL